MDTFDFEMAGLFCQRALDVDSNNLQALDMLGHICSELGDTQKAKEISFMPVSFFVVMCMLAIQVMPLKHCYVSILFEYSEGCSFLDQFSLSFSTCSGAEPRCRPQ